MGSAQLRSLRDGVDALLMTGGCRPAGLAFLRGVREGWTPADFGRWLVGTYAEATSLVPRVEADGDEGRDEAQPRRVAGTTVREILEGAREAVEAALASAAEGGTQPAFVQDAIEGGAVVQTLDGIWIALDRPRMLLRDRILALFACDYLLRPSDYADRLALCERCHAVAFDPAARQTRHCGTHRISDFIALTRRSEPPAALRSA